MHISLFCYKAKVVSVYDGDTCRVDIDLGVGVWKSNETLRLHRINAPELRGTEYELGKLSRDYLRSLISDRDVLLQTIRDKKGKYGRYLAEIWVVDAESGLWINVNDEMIRAKHAKYYGDEMKPLQFDVNEIV